MKNLLLVLSILIGSLGWTCYADENKLVSDIEMVSYEQGWLDNEGTIALRNNTDKPINRVKFILEYLDMDGNQLDYKEFSKKVDIAPGMVKKVNVTPYEHDRRYSYYKSEAAISRPRKFMVNFRLQSVNAGKTGKIVDDKKAKNIASKNKAAEKVLATEALSSSVADDDFPIKYEDNAYKRKLWNGNSEKSYSETEHTFWNKIAGFIGFMVALSIVFGIYWLIYAMAKRKNRNPAAWIAMSLFFTPFFIILILLCLGPNRRYYE